MTTRRRSEATLAPTLAVMVLVATAAVGQAAGPAKLASEQMKAGYDAARRGYWQEALTRFENANDLQPEQPRTLNNIAVALEATGEYEAARATYERALQLGPGNDHLRQNFERFEEFYESYLAPDEGEEGDEEGDDASAASQDSPVPDEDDGSGNGGGDDAGA